MSEQIGRLKNLRMLDLGHNQLTSVPDALGDLDGLTDFLYLHDNRLTSLPQSLESLTKLRYLNIGDNAFDVLPESICAMANLMDLRASGNRLSALPDSIGLLSRLRELHLRDNQFDVVTGIDRNTPRTKAARSSRQSLDQLAHRIIDAAPPGQARFTLGSEA